MERTATNTNSFKEKKFSTAASKSFLAKMENEQACVFIMEHALLNLYKQADVHFGNENWYTVAFEESFKDNWHYFTITCQGK